MADNNVRQRKITLEKAEGTITVTRANYAGGARNEEESYSQKIDVPIFNTTPAKVRVAAGVTRNVGDFNSVRVDVSIEMPCYPEMSEIRRVYSLLSAEAERLVNQELGKEALVPDYVQGSK